MSEEKGKYITDGDFVCNQCDRKQSYAPADERGGVTMEEAQTVGWRKVSVEDYWLCPFCSGNEDKLREVFNNDQ